jgi:hypothetical protein
VVLGPCKTIGHIQIHNPGRDTPLIERIFHQGQPCSGKGTAVEIILPAAILATRYGLYQPKYYTVPAKIRSPTIFHEINALVFEHVNSFLV